MIAEEEISLAQTSQATLFKKITSPEAQAKLLSKIEEAGGSKTIGDLLVKAASDEDRVGLFKAFINLSTGFEPGAKIALEGVTSQRSDEQLLAIKSTFEKVEFKHLGFHFLVNAYSNKGASQLVKITEIRKNCILWVILEQSVGYYYSRDYARSEQHLGEAIEFKKLEEWGELFGQAGCEGKACFDESNVEAVWRLCDNLGVGHEQWAEWIFHHLQIALQEKRAEIVRDVEAKLLQDREYFKEKTFSISLKDVQFLIKEYHNSIKIFMEAKPSQESSHLLIPVHRIIKLLIPITHLGGYNANLQNLFVPDTLSITAELLQFLQTHYYKEKIPLLEEAAFELNTNIIRLEGNLVHANPVAKKVLIDKNLAACLMGHMGIDKMNPLSKEATIVFLRYMAEGSPEITSYIQSMKVYDLEDQQNRLYTKSNFM